MCRPGDRQPDRQSVDETHRDAEDRIPGDGRCRRAVTAIAVVAEHEVGHGRRRKGGSHQDVDLVATEGCVETIVARLPHDARQGGAVRVAVEPWQRHGLLEVLLAEPAELGACVVSVEGHDVGDGPGPSCRAAGQVGVEAVLELVEQRRAARRPRRRLRVRAGTLQEPDPRWSRRPLRATTRLLLRRHRSGRCRRNGPAPPRSARRKRLRPCRQRGTDRFPPWRRGAPQSSAPTGPSGLEHPGCARSG